MTVGTESMQPQLLGPERGVQEPEEEVLSVVQGGVRVSPLLIRKGTVSYKPQCYSYQFPMGPELML